MNEINLIWQTEPGNQTNFEYEYITNILFKNFKKNIFFDKSNLNLVINNSVIIYSYDSENITEKFEEYINKYVQNKYNFYLLHLSNKNLSHNFSYYSKANHVFRQYYDERINLDNVTFIPAGFKSGFMSNEISLNKKTYNFSFIGNPNNDRGEIIDVIQNLNGFVHASTQLVPSTLLNEEICKGIYNQTKFVPCPKGLTNKDSFRIMESLESGSIPILMKYDNLDYFFKIWGESPLPVINNWENLNEFANFSDTEYETLFLKVKEWYLNFKNKLSNRIEEKIINKNEVILIGKEKIKFNSLIHFITPLHKKNNLRILYPNILNLTQDFNWYLIEGKETIGCESIDSILEDNRIHYYKIKTEFIYGHEQRNYFIENIECGDNDWCFFLDDDTIVTQDLIEVAVNEKNSDFDVILLSQKQGLTERVRLHGLEGRMTLGNVDIGSFLIRYSVLKNTKIGMEHVRNSDGHFAEHISNIPNIKIKYCPEKYTRYNSLSLEII